MKENCNFCLKDFELTEMDIKAFSEKGSYSDCLIRLQGEDYKIVCLNCEKEIKRIREEEYRFYQGRVSGRVEQYFKDYHKFFGGRKKIKLSLIRGDRGYSPKT